MRTYILNRLLLFVPTLLVISLITFFLSQNTPGDPVALMLNRSDQGGNFTDKTLSADKEYKEARIKLGLHLPVFYFGISDQTIPDTLHHVSNPVHRALISRLCSEYGRREFVLNYFNTLIELRQELMREGSVSGASANLEQLLTATDDQRIEKGIQDLKESNVSTTELERRFLEMSENRSTLPKFIPAIHWYGTNNQYHRWLSGFIQGDFGISYKDKLPVSSLIEDAIYKTLIISILAIICSYLIAIPLGIHSAVKKGSKEEKLISSSLFALYSLPNFWVATLLVIFFCGGDYLDWFPGPGTPPPADDAGWLVITWDAVYRNFLPLLCWTYGSLAFISRQMRGGILESIKEDYIRTARAKGLDEKNVVMKHALRNSLLPIITLFAGIFPLVISGSFVIETIFNIQGMGKLTIEALYARDYPIIFTLMLFTALLTMAGNLLADLFYAWSDPRISYAKNASN